MRLVFAFAAAVAIWCFAMPAGHAQSYGNAPWCAVQDLGAGDVVWDCEFRSAAECAPNVVAGNRGFCNINPYWTGPDPAQAPPGAAPRQRRVRQY